MAYPNYYSGDAGDIVVPREESSCNKMAHIDRVWVHAGNETTEISGHASFTEADERGRFRIAANEANLKVESGASPVVIRIKFKLSDGTSIEGKFEVKSILDVDEFIDFDEDSCHPEVYEWGKMITQGKNPPPEEGSQYLYFSIVDGDKPIGRVTARYIPIDERTYELALAFCRKEDSFSKCTGRAMVDRRMQVGSTIVAKKRSVDGTMFRNVMYLLSDIMRYGESTLVLENTHVYFPYWIKPKPHPALPPAVISVLRRIVEGTAGHAQVETAKEYLGMTGDHQTKFIEHR